MKTIKLKGGLGNQLFQYSYGRNLIEKGKKVIFDISFFSSYTKDTPRPFLLNKFNIHSSIRFEYRKQNFFIKFIKRTYSKITSQYNFFQSELYFKDIEDILKKEFTLKDPLSDYANIYENQIIHTQNSISVHVRRGDYVSNISAHTHHGLCNLEYYQKAISYIKERIQSPTFFIFSDDIEWVKENLSIEDAVYVSNPNLTECEELILMSHCLHNIIANSTFSWWAAWLNSNSNKIVIAPEKWLNTDIKKQPDIIPKTWIKI